MRIFGRMMVTGVAAVVAGLPGIVALAERPVAADTDKTGTQVNAGQALEQARVVEAEVSMMLVDGRYVAVIDRVKAMASPSALMLNDEGVAYEHLGGYDNAKVCYEEAIGLNAKYSNAYNNLGTIYYARHNNAMAMKMYKKAIKLDSKSSSAYKNLGAAYFNKGKLRQGAEAFEQALILDPNVLDRQGLSMQAEDRGTLVTMNYFLAQLCAKSGRNDAAIAYLNRAIANGFRDYGRLQKDDAFASVREMPEFPTPGARR